MEMMSWLNNHDLLFLVDSVLPWAHSPAGELGAGFLSPCGLTCDWFSGTFANLKEASLGFFM